MSIAFEIWILSQASSGISIHGHVILGRHFKILVVERRAIFRASRAEVSDRRILQPHRQRLV